MAGSTITVFFALVVALGASFYQLCLKDLLTTTFGVGRVLQSIDEFPYTCRRIEHPRLEACEDIWLDDEGRALYAACSGTAGRLAWNQAMKQLNATGRRPGGSELIALDIDNPGADGFFNLRNIIPKGYTGATGNSDLDLLGFDAHRWVDMEGIESVQFYFVNMRPPVDASKNIIDASKIGANSTVELFELKNGEDEMQHRRTIWSSEIYTPNRVAALGVDQGTFLLTNDHSVKVGIRRELDYFIGGGNVVVCNRDDEHNCQVAYSGDEKDETIASTDTDEPRYKALLNKALNSIPKAKLKFPNGLARGSDGLFYVPSATDGTIRVLRLNRCGCKLDLVETISVGMPLDNLSPDANGDIYAAGFPDLMQTAKSFADPVNEISPVTIWRIRKVIETDAEGVDQVDYRVEKVIEDREGKVLSGSTTVRHDAKTGRLFISACVHPYLVVCEPH